MTSQCERMCEMLVVEDNPDDFELTRLAFAENGCDALLRNVGNGQECMDYLRRQGPYARASMPDLVLLDINMPVMDGYEVISRIVADPILRHLPIVILTTSDAGDDILRMYRLRCNAYVVKPADFNEFTRVVHSLRDFWCSTARLPRPQPGSRER